MIATSGFLTALECTQFVFVRGSAPGPAYSAPRDLVAGLRGPTSKEEEEGSKRKGEEEVSPACFQDKNRPWTLCFLHKSVTIIHLLLSESHHHLTPSNVTSKLTTLPRHNTHLPIATTPHL